MKKFFLAMMAVATIALVGCKKDDNSGGPIKSDVPDVPATEGAYTVVWNAVGFSECVDLVFAGNYNDWSTDPANMVKFEKIEGYTNWYKAVITDQSAAGIDHLEGKPCGLKEDGTFPSGWDYQWIGSEEKPCELIKGEAEFQVEYTTETKIIMTGDIIFVRSYGFKTDPCVKEETYDITFNLAVDAEVPAGKNVILVGAFENSWVAGGEGAYVMERVDNQHFKIIMHDVALGKEYKYLVEAQDAEGKYTWDNEMYLVAPEEGDECVAKAANLTVSDVEVNDQIAGFVGITTTLPFCEEEKPEPSTLTTPEVLYLIGNVNDNNWTPANGIEMVKNGDTFSTTINAQGDGTAYFAFTSVKSDDWTAVNAARVGGANNDDVTAGGDFGFVGYGEYNFTATTGTQLNVVIDFSTQKATFTPAN